jgi:hypothetical protein
MPATAIPIISTKVELEFVPGSGTYVDISARCYSSTIVHPRTAPGEDAEPTLLELGLFNHPATAAELTAWGALAGAAGYCPFTPDAPTAAFYPNVARGRRIKVTYIWAGGASTSVRGQFWITTWTPDAGKLPPATATVAVNAACILSKYAQKKAMSNYGEYQLLSADMDYWPYDDDPGATTLRVSSRSALAVPAEVINPATRTGSATLSEPDGGHLTDGQIEFTRGDPNGPSPVVLHTMRASSVDSVAIWVKLSIDPAGATDDIMAAYDASGNRVWRMTAGIVSGLVQWTIQDDANFAHSYNTPTYGRDDAWRYLRLWFSSATQSSLSIRIKGDPTPTDYGNAGAWTTDPRAFKYLVVGGQMPPMRRGKQTNTLSGTVSSLNVQYVYTGNLGDESLPNYSVTAFQVLARVANYTIPLDALVGGGSVGGSAADTITPLMWTLENTNMLQLWNQYSKTVGGRLTTLPDGRRSFRYYGETRLSTVALTLDAELDLSEPDGGWSGTKEETPTRISVSGPIGSTVVVNTAAETQLGVTIEGSGISTMAGSIGVAQSVGQQILAATSARLNSFGFDMSLTSTDKVTAALALRPGDRIRISGLNSAVEGGTYKDVYASGWIEESHPAQTVNGDSVTFIFDTDPADAPPEAVWDDAEYGRWGMADGTVTGGTCVGTTATGTVIITTSDPITGAAGDYTLDLNWNGERITVSFAAGTTSPQTRTVTARGVAPTVARVHAAGETIDTWNPFTWSN